VIVCFVYIGGIVDQHLLAVVFLYVGVKQQSLTDVDFCLINSITVRYTCIDWNVEGLCVYLFTGMETRPRNEVFTDT
jgi:hypothetical protein